MTEVHIRLPDGLKSSKQINVLITPSKIKITPKLNDSHEVIVDGEVDEKFKYNEAMWTISANGKLTMSLGNILSIRFSVFVTDTYYSVDKKVEIWWKRLFQHEPAIDVTKIDCSQPIDELTEETRRDIERIQWDEEQKLSGRMETIVSLTIRREINVNIMLNLIQFVGKPTSSQLKQHELLKKAWDVDGSPFKGMPFDPSLVQFENS